MDTLSKLYNDWSGTRRRKKLIDITREEWIEWWKATGVFDQRGPNAGQYFMSRIDKSLPFSIDNIELKQRKQRRER